MKLFDTNQSNSEKIVRFTLGVLLLSVPLVIGITKYSIAIGTIEIISIFNVVIGTFFIYKMFGINTCKINN